MRCAANVILIEVSVSSRANGPREQVVHVATDLGHLLMASMPREVPESIVGSGRLGARTR